MLKWALDLFFPPVCGICGEKNQNWLCSKCKIDIEIKKKNINTKVYLKYYEEILFIFKYEEIRNEILQYKFSNKAYLSNMFVNIILNDKKICDKIKLYDIILSVPMTKKKKSRRGYNQTELISKKISQNLNIEYKNNVLVKEKNNLTQSSLTEKERFENVKNVFKVQNEEIIKNKKIILFDDILTTGATVNECAKQLKKAGAKEILVFTLAKD
ncbi:MAG: ComF family protein [Clostridia bacterium]|nr:ComF family protein [Clostridia bacterium]